MLQKQMLLEHGGDAFLLVMGVNNPDILLEVDNYYMDITLKSLDF